MSELASTAISSAEVSEINTIPRLPDFAHQPIQEIFDFKGVLTGLREQGVTRYFDDDFGFGYRSAMWPDLSEAKLTELNDLDGRVVAEAELAPGFKHYEKGTPLPDGTCISVCFWDSPESARAALSLPAHSEAVQRIQEFYQWCTLDYMMVTDTPDGPIINPLGPPKHMNFTI